MARFLRVPREMKFYDFFGQSAGNLVVAAQTLADLFNNYEDVEAKVSRMEDLEHQGDSITHQIIQHLHRTFVTPIDREDIALLANSLDDVMDFIEGAARRAMLYRISQPTEAARKLTSIIIMLTCELNEAIPLLRDRKQFKQILEKCVKINTLENEADDVHHAALAELFDNATDPYDLIKWREIYELLESATDRAEDVANVLEGIVLKHA